MGFCRAGAEGDDVGDEVFVLFALADGFFDGELVEGVHGVLDAVGFDAGVGFVDAGLDLERKRWLAGFVGCGEVLVVVVGEGRE